MKKVGVFVLFLVLLSVSVFAQQSHPLGQLSEGTSMIATQTGFKFVGNNSGGGYDQAVIGADNTRTSGLTYGVRATIVTNDASDSAALYGWAGGTSIGAVKRYGVYGYNTGVGNAVYGYTAGVGHGVSGKAVYGGYAGVHGEFSTLNPNITNGDGVWGVTNSYAGVGVYGRASASSVGASGVGVYGESWSPVGTGVKGRASFFAIPGNVTIGVYGEATGGRGIGVFGNATSTIGNNYGVYGATASSSGYAGYFTGGQGVWASTINVFQSGYSGSADTTMTLPTGTWTVMAWYKYYACEDYDVTIYFDGNSLYTSGDHGDTSGCDTNTLMGYKTGASGGQHNLTSAMDGGSRSEHQWMWIAFKTA